MDAGRTSPAPRAPLASGVAPGSPSPGAGRVGDPWHSRGLHVSLPPPATYAHLPRIYRRRHGPPVSRRPGRMFGPSKRSGCITEYLPGTAGGYDRNYSVPAGERCGLTWYLSPLARRRIRNQQAGCGQGALYVQGTGRPSGAESHVQPRDYRGGMESSTLDQGGANLADGASVSDDLAAAAPGDHRPSPMGADSGAAARPRERVVHARWLMDTRRAGPLVTLDNVPQVRGPRL